MRPLILSVFVVCSLTIGTDARFFSGIKAHGRTPYSGGEDTGDPLFLTPYIQDGQTDLGRNLSRIMGLPGAENIISYSGLITVNATYNSNIFFWYIPALAGAGNEPVNMWLDGGPGVSSMYALFVENGPFRISQDLNLSISEFTWSEKMGMLYVDNPVGAGFSFTEDERGFVTSEDEVSRDLYEFLTQFFTLFPDLLSRDFYISGESYAGKYIPAIGYKIHTENPTAAEKINLKGLIIGSGYTDPASILDYGSFLYGVGLLDEIELAVFEERQKVIADLMAEERWMDAYLVVDRLILGLKGTEFYNATGINQHYNILRTEDNPDQGYYPDFLEFPDVRKAIHVGGLEYNDGNHTVFLHLGQDIMQTVKPLLEELMEHYKTIIYGGNLDIIVPTPLVEGYVSKLQWSGAEEYSKTPRSIYRVSPSDEEVAGYIRSVGTFHRFVCRNAGHDGPYDQPRVLLDIINKFVFDQF